MSRRAPELTRRRVLSPYTLLPLLSAGLIVTVEAGLTAQGRVLASQIASAGLVLMLLNAGALLRGDSREAQAGRAAMHALALIPLIRVVGAGLPLRDLSSTTEQLLVAVPVGAAAFFMAPIVGVPREMFVVARQAHLQMAALGCGLALGLLAYLLGAPALWSAGAASSRILLAITVAILAAAVLEIVFRGVVQVSLQRVAGRAGVVGASVLFSATYLDAGSAAFVMTAALAGVIFAYVVDRTATLGGVVVGQALFAVGSGGLWPALLGREHPSWSDDSAVALGLGTALVAATVILLGRPAARTVGGLGEPLERRGAEPAPEPRLRDQVAAGSHARTRPRIDARTQIVGLGCLLIAFTGVAGYFVGRSGEPNPGPAELVAAGPLSVTLPGDWERRQAPAALTGGTGTRAIAGGPRETPRAWIVVWRASPADAHFRPRGFDAADTPSVKLVYLGRYDAYRHRGLRARENRLVPTSRLMDPLQTTAYSIPTAAGAAVVACYAPQSLAQRFMPECEKAASTLDLSGLRAAARGTVADDHRRLNAIITELARRRSAGRRRLSAARTPASQAAAARGLEGAYRAARRSLERSPAGPATRTRQAKLTAELKRVETGYSRLRRAAGRRSHRRYDSARRLIARSEAVLRRLLTAL